MKHSKGKYFGASDQFPGVSISKDVEFLENSVY